MTSRSTTITRQQYLERLGIVQYVRRGLKQAKDTAQSIDATHDASAVNRIQESSLTLSPVSKNDGSATRRDLSGIAAKIKTKINTQPNIASIPAVQQETLQLQFALWQATDEFLVCGELKATSPSQEQLTLLGNILVAMGQTHGDLSQFESIDWPPCTSISANDETEARDYLSTLLKARVDGKNIKTVLILGDSTAGWLCSPQQLAANGGVQFQDHVIELVISPLADMLVQPELKRQSWQTICAHLPHLTSR